MAVTGKTQKFQSLSNQVKGQDKPQEPLISTDQITQLFDDFGFQPEKSDLTYWSHQPESTKTKLVNELKTRLDEEKTAQKEDQVKQQGPSHLTDQQITSIYSEYGFPTPKSSSDFEWVRQNFPDDEQKIRAIFDNKRKQMDQMMKIKGQNTINTIKQQSNPTTPSQPNGMLINNQGGQGGVYSGQGGPSDGTSGTSDGGTKWVFPSRYVVVKFTGDPNGSADGDEKTLWLLDSNSKQIQPFLSMTAFTNFFGDSAEKALKSVANLDPKDLLTNGPGSDFNLLGNSYGINDNGQVPVVDASQQQIKSLYGKSPDSQAVSNSYTTLDGFLDLMNKNGGSGIDSGTINNILNDQTQMAKYISALAYGGYSLTDVYKDIKRKELINKGDQTLQNIQVIDPSLTKQEYLKTDKGQTSQGIATINPPTSIGNINSSVLNSPITQLPDEAFNTLVPPVDINSQDFKDQMDKVQSAFHDILIDQVNATTEASKAAADDKYKTFRDYLDKTYGWKLSDDAVQGWQQLQKISNDSANAGLAGSGIENEQTDNALKNVRQQDKQIRENKAYDTETAAATKAQATASPEEITRMNQEDQAKGLPKTEWRSYRWGLMPSDSVLASLDINTLKQKYPNASEADLNLMRSEILDENGNYRSTLYQNRTDNLYKVKYGGTMSDKLATTGSLQDYKTNTVLNKNLEAEKKASAPYTMTDTNDPFANLGTTNTTIPESLKTNQTTQPEVPKYDTNAASEAAKNISSNLSNNPAKTNTNTAGKTYIPNVAAMKDYTNITKPDANGKLYGTPISAPATSTPSDPTAGRIKIPNLSIMGKYKPDQYDRIGTSVYLKSGVKQNW